MCLPARPPAACYLCCRGEFETGAWDYFFNDSLLSSHFHRFRVGFWGVDWPFGGSGGLYWLTFGSLGFDWPFSVLGGLRPRDFGIHYSGKIRRPPPA